MVRRHVEIARRVEPQVAVGVTPDRDRRLLKCLRLAGARSRQDAQLDRHYGLGAVVPVLLVTVPALCSTNHAAPTTSSANRPIAMSRPALRRAGVTTGVSGTGGF